MEQIFRLHDKDTAGVKLDNYLQVGVLGCADDVALVSFSTSLLPCSLKAAVAFLRISFRFILND